MELLADKSKNEIYSIFSMPKDKKEEAQFCALCLQQEEGYKIAKSVKDFDLY